MSLQPGTRIPKGMKDAIETDMDELHLEPAARMAAWNGAIEGVEQSHRIWMQGYLRGALLWGPLGLLMGSVLTACALALAWAHMGG